MAYLTLKIRGERWVAYPGGMRFPRQFKSLYPFRGRGLVSRMLYMFNKLHVDRLFLRKEILGPDLAKLTDVAFFWPSSIRSTGRFYGYHVSNGKIDEYIKVATSENEKDALQREAGNVAIALKISGGAYKVPQCLGVEKIGSMLVARFEPLPEIAVVPPVEEKWLARARRARNRILAEGYMHGDFTWHNFKCVGDELWILDWEEMQKGGCELSDEIALELGLDYYWRGKKLHEVFYAFRARYAKDEKMWTKALGAVRDLRERKITMGDLLGKEFLK